ncbi:MAG: PAS domain-containing protein [Rhodothermales bacterium]|nr:PAS domain-containing protein [Rhodothermales bacterium]
MGQESQIVGFPGTNPYSRTHVNPERAGLLLDAGCNITDISPSARKLIGYGPAAPIDPCFFAHIHSRNLVLVMRDLASMACNGKRRARWMVRMRNADEQWVWMRVTARKMDQIRPTGFGFAVELAHLDA